jgi:hypothetical protein
MFRKSQGHISPCAREHIHQHPEALGATLNIIKDNAWTSFLTQHCLRGKTDIFMPVGTFHIFDFTKPVS